MKKLMKWLSNYLLYNNSAEMACTSKIRGKDGV